MLPDLNTPFVCSMSGVVADEDDAVHDAPKGDVLGTLPVGWSRVTVERRLENARWDDIQQAKTTLVQMTLANVPEEHRGEAEPMIAMQVDAQFAALEAATDRYVTITEVLYVAPPEDDAELAKEWFAIRQTLGLSIPDAEEDDDATASEAT